MYLTEDEFKILCGIKIGLNSKKIKEIFEKVRSKRQMGTDRCCKYEKS